MTSAYALYQDVTDQVYLRLINDLVDNEDWFGLVWQDSLAFDRSARAVFPRLKPYRLSHTRTHRWPGTQGQMATVTTYRATSRIIDFLLQPARLFGWQCPKYPEDLFFGSDTDGLALATVAHDDSGWLFRKRYASIIGPAALNNEEALTRRECKFFEWPV
ncbi:MAG: hypothetical protein K0U98_10560 [Deltaproteobacteria bacterium]|nr:hypothetical protein [Deltaproteobacteria bacterium]